MRATDMHKRFRCFTRGETAFLRETCDLIVESPLEIIINDARRVLVMFSPHMTRELVCGFLFTEGLINHVSEIEDCVISVEEGSNGDRMIEARVRISRGLPPVSDPGDRRVSYSSCGICGRDNYYGLSEGLRRVKSKSRFSMDVLTGIPDALPQFQPLYEMTGGAHAAVLFDAGGGPVLHCEDMGRHNALDKVIGAALINGISCDDKILVTSGRASLEMILKTVRAGCPAFVAMSRPTSRAVDAAKFYNVTLLDMAKESNRIYSHARRIIGFNPSESG